MSIEWGPDRESAENSVKKYQVKMVKNYSDMVDRIDVVIFSVFYDVGLWPKLSKSYIEVGISALLNRPFAHSLRGAKEMIEQSKEYWAPIYVPLV